MSANARTTIMQRRARVYSLTTSNNTSTPFDFRMGRPPNSPKIVVIFQLLSEHQISIRADYDATLLPAMERIENATWDQQKQCWLIPATRHAYGRALQSIPTRTPNLNIEVVRLSPALVKVLQEVSLAEDEMAVRETMVQEQLSLKVRQEGGENGGGRRLWDALKPFQRAAVTEGVRRNGRLLLADASGLGKTLQALGIALAYQDDWPILIICPKQKQPSWVEAIERWLDVHDDDIHISTNRANLLGRNSAVSRKRKVRTLAVGRRPTKRRTMPRNNGQQEENDHSSGEQEHNGNNFSEEDEEEEEEEALVERSHHKFHIITYELATKFETEIENYRFRFMICDESHSIKSRTVSLL